MIGRTIACVLAAGLLLAACDEAEQAETPAPQVLTREAIGHYCQMIVADHQGPKAQIFLSDRDAPVWFSSVRDAIAFTLLPEEPKNIAAVYVTDMAVASWDAPEPHSWIDAKTAHFVIESERRGGMGALEAVPFGDLAAAESFIARHGGQVVSYGEIPSGYILNAEAEAVTTHDHETPDHETFDHDMADQDAMDHGGHEEQSGQGEAQHDGTH